MLNSSFILLDLFVVKADEAAWENNRMLVSGVMRETNVATEFDDEEDSRVQIMG